MNNTSLKVADEMISCGNPLLLVALLKRAATEAKANFRTTEGELLHMFQCVDLVEEMEDTIKSLNKQLIQLVESSEPKQVAKKPVEKAEEKVAKAASPKKKVMRRKRRSDMGKKREGAALENIRKAAKKNAVKRRLSKRLELAKKQVVEQNTVS